jgi:hypothetical protein
LNPGGINERVDRCTVMANAIGSARGGGEQQEPTNDVDGYRSYSPAYYPPPPSGYPSSYVPANSAPPFLPPRHPYDRCSATAAALPAPTGAWHPHYPAPQRDNCPPYPPPYYPSPPYADPAPFQPQTLPPPSPPPPPPRSYPRYTQGYPKQPPPLHFSGFDYDLVASAPPPAPQSKQPPPRHNDSIDDPSTSATSSSTAPPTSLRHGTSARVFVSLCDDTPTSPVRSFFLASR